MEMFFIHEKEANSILTKSGLKHLAAVTPSIENAIIWEHERWILFTTLTT